MITPDNTNIGDSIRKVQGLDSEEKSKDKIRPPRPVNKNFEQVLDEDGKPHSEFTKSGKVKPDGVAFTEPEPDEIAEDEPQSVIQLLASKAGKPTKELSEEIADNAASLGVVGKPTKRGESSLIALSSSIPKEEEGETIVGWPAGKTSTKSKTVAPPEEKQSPFKVFKETAAPVREDFEAASEGVSDFVPTTSKRTTSKTEKESKFDDVQPDLTAVNPLASTGTPNTTVNAVAESVAPIDRAALVAKIQALAEKVVDAIYTLDKSGVTETIVTIKNLPMFNDARIVLTSFNTAPKEFNIAFENLRPDAKKMIDQNLGTLKIALDDQGFVNVIHILSTTTIIEHRLPGDAPTGQSFARGGRDTGGGPSGERRQKGKEGG